MKYLPDFLSLTRLFLLPFAVIKLSNHDVLSGSIILALMVATDLLDGRLARKFKSTSKFGALLDHGVDKIVSITLAWVVKKYYGFSSWAFYLITGREIALVIGGLFLWKTTGRNPGANRCGKIGGAFLFASLYGYVIDFRYKEQLLIAAIAMILLSTISYLVMAVKRFLTGRAYQKGSNP